MRVVYFGAGEFAVPSLRWLINSHHEIVLVVTQPDRPAGRGKHLTPTPVGQCAAEHGLPLAKCPDVNDAGFIEQIRRLEARIGVVAAFGQKILGPVRSVFPSECINLHGSLLPKFRGAGPVAAAILAGERKTGVTVFRLVDRMDAGPMLVKRETAIGATETAGELHDRLAGIACDALDAAMRLHEIEVLPAGEPQDESLATRAPKLKKSDGYLRFTDSADQLARQCRAMWPWPGARCRFVPAEGEGVEVTLVTVSPLPFDSQVPPGMLSRELTVGTGAGTLEVHSLQPSGKRVMGWKDFVNGRHVRPADRFVSIEAAET